MQNLDIFSLKKGFFFSIFLKMSEKKHEQIYQSNSDNDEFKSIYKQFLN